MRRNPLPDSLQREMPRSRLGSAIPRSYGIAKDRLSKGAEGRGDGVAMVVVEERGGERSCFLSYCHFSIRSYEAESIIPDPRCRERRSVETRWDSSITFLLRTKRQRGREREREPECSFRFLERGSCTLGETWNVYFLFAFHIKISIKGIKIFITDSVTS